MILTLRVLLGCIGLAGGACATIIPINIYSGGVVKSNSVDQGRIANQLQLTKCTGTNEGGSDSITFGDKVTAPICGKLKDSSENKNQEIESVNTALTELLKREGNKVKTYFSQDTVGRPMCVVGGSGPQGILSKSPDRDSVEDNVKYIGTCNTSTVNTSAVSFLEIDNSTSKGKNPTLKLCYQECGTTSQSEESDSSIFNFQNKNISKWRELSFIKQSSS